MDETGTGNDHVDVAVDEVRLRRRLAEMGDIGANEVGGIDRQAYSPAHLEACDRFAVWARDAGADVEVDAVGNVIARFGPEIDPAGPAPIVVGSHLDTVPNGGRYDGALGVLAGLEALQTIVAADQPLARPVLLIAFADEEGAHGAGTVGSRAMCFGLSERDLAVRKDPTSPALAESMRLAGFDPHDASAARRDVRRWDAFVEVHPEQGGVLEARGLSLAVVTSIVASARLKVQLFGAANHAGTTPMADRDDALVKSARLITMVDAYARDHRPPLVATVGRLLVAPNTVNVIPGRVDLTVDVRAPEEHHVDDAIEWLQGVVEATGGACEVVIRKQGVRMDDRVRADLQAAVGAVTEAWTDLPSGAGHDARTVAQAGVPTGMLFVPSRGGVSHSPDEFSTHSHCVTATRVLTRFLAHRLQIPMAAISPQG